MPQHDSPHVSVIILNWNTWRDTVECIESLYHNAYKNFTVLLVDNNSTDDSREQLLDWFSGKSKKTITTQFPDSVYPVRNKPVKVRSITIEQGEIKQEESGKPKEDDGAIIMLLNDHNAGFAKANNIAIRYVLKYLHSSYIYILNNDTVIDKNALRTLIAFMEENNTTGAATSTIYQYDNPQQIAIAGGTITPWAKVVHYQDKVSENMRKVRFVSGCALLVRTQVFSKYGVLSERFYYGEEDIEFSLRMNRLNIDMVCLYTSIVFHKVSRSAQQYFSSRAVKVYLNALNRLINMKQFFSPLKWYTWRLFVLMYFFYLFKKHHVSSKRALGYIFEIYRLSNELDRVDKATVESILLKD